MPSGGDRHQRATRVAAAQRPDPSTVGLAQNPGGWWVRGMPKINNGVGHRAGGPRESRGDQGGLPMAEPFDQFVGRLVAGGAVLTTRTA